MSKATKAAKPARPPKVATKAAKAVKAVKATKPKVTTAPEPEAFVPSAQYQPLPLASAQALDRKPRYWTPQPYDVLAEEAKRKAKQQQAAQS